MSSSESTTGGVGSVDPAFCPKSPLQWALNFEEIISGLGMCTIIVVITANVCMRYFFSRSIAWAEEIAVIGFSCVIFLGSAVVYKRHMHVGIDFVVNCLPNRVQACVVYLTELFLLAFNAYITYLAWIYSLESWDKPTSILFIPYFFVNIPIFLGFASMTAYAARDVYVRNRNWLRPPGPQAAERSGQ